MKKIIAIGMVLILIGALCACANMSMGIGSFEFNKVHVDTYNYSGCFTVMKWYDSETGVEVKTKEAGSMFLSEGTYFLISDDCPFCACLPCKDRGGKSPALPL